MCARERQASIPNLPHLASGLLLSEVFGSCFIELCWHLVPTNEVYLILIVIPYFILTVFLDVPLYVILGADEIKFS